MQLKSVYHPVSMSGRQMEAPLSAHRPQSLWLQQRNRPSLGRDAGSELPCHLVSQKRPLCFGLKQSFSPPYAPPTSPPSSLNKVMFYKQVSCGRQWH